MARMEWVQGGKVRNARPSTRQASNHRISHHSFADFHSSFRTDCLSTERLFRRRLFLLLLRFGCDTLLQELLICAEVAAANIAEPIDSLNIFSIFSRQSCEHILSLECISLEDLE